MSKRVENDLTARKQVEEALRRDKEFAENLLESAQVIVLVLDSIGRIVRLNPYLEKISGYHVKDVQGKDWFTTFLPEPERNSLRARFLKLMDVSLPKYGEGEEPQRFCHHEMLPRFGQTHRPMQPCSAQSGV